MKNYIRNSIFRGSVFLLAILLSVSVSNAAVVNSCLDLDTRLTPMPGVGHIEIVSKSGCTVRLRAVPEEGSMFNRWTDNNSKNPLRTIVLDTDDADLEIYAEFYYVKTHCNTCGDYDLLDTVGSHIRYGYIEATKSDGSCWQLRATPNYGYVFAQWNDGNAENPRTIDIIDEDEVTYYATFIPKNKKGKVDRWEADDEEVLSGIRITDPETLGAYYATVFFDGKLAGSYPIQLFDDGVYLMLYNTSQYDARTYAGKKCHIVIKNPKENCNPFATLDTIIPYLVTGPDNVIALDMTDRVRYGVHVLPDANATFTGDPQNIAELDIYAGGKATIASTVNATSVIMRTDWLNEAIPQLLVTSDGHLNNTNGPNIVYYDVTLDYSHFYPFALPSDVKINTDQVRYRSGESAQDHFALETYDGKKRARGQSSCWAPYYYYSGYDDDGIAATGDVDINPGNGYLIYAEPLLWKGLHEQRMYGANIRFPMTVNLTSAQGTKSISVGLNDNDGAATAQNKNWNLIALPYVSAYQGTITAVKYAESGEPNEELEYVTRSNNTYFTSGYTHETPSTYTLQPFNAYFVQVPDHTQYLRFEVGTEHEETKLSAPRRAIKTVDADRIKAGLTLTQADNSDHAGLLIGEKYTNDYDINGDLAKMFGSDQGLALFMLSGSEKLAYIALPPATGNGVSETVIPLGYNKAAMGQEMTFAFDEDRYPSVRFDERIQALELIDYVEGTTTNLLQEPYTCTAYEKADNTRFALGIRYTKTGANVTTGICDDVAASKVNDGIYDLMGRRVNADDARSLGAGVYIIMENGKARKEVIR